MAGFQTLNSERFSPMASPALTEENASQLPLYS